MGLIICVACGRQRLVKPIKRQPMRCSNCNAAHPRTIRRLKAWMDATDKPGIEPLEAQRRTMAGLRWWAQHRGYKPGWSARKFKTIFGVWPPDDLQAPAEPPLLALMYFIGRETAAYARQAKANKPAMGGLFT